MFEPESGTGLIYELNLAVADAAGAKNGLYRA